MKQFIKNFIKKYDFLYSAYNKIRNKYIRCIYIPLEKSTNYKNEKKVFENKHGYKLNLKDPKTFNEKVVWKKLYNRNKLLTITQDKFLYRKYIKDKLGSKKANDILVPLIHSTKEPESISFNSLPDEYIIKPNNAAGRYFIKRKEDKINKETIIKNCKEWLSKVYGIKLHEWAYKDIEPRILIEKLITDENGSIADDYKFFCYNGKCKFVQVISNRHVDEKRSIYTSDWEFLDIKYKGYRSVPGVIKPKNYNKMIEIAEVLSKDFNFVRIDMYNINGNIFFGEFTHYPVSGHGKIEPVDYDYEFGKYWDINKDEARK